jgi:transglutaminase-like putative cysteine protease
VNTQATVTYEVRQTTTYMYDSPAALGRHVLRMLPGAQDGQKVLDARLDVVPEPVHREETRDFFGNRATRLSFEDSHRLLSLDMTARIELTIRPDIDGAATARWEAVRAEASITRDLGPRSPVHMSFPSRYVPLLPQARAYAAASFAPGVTILAGALDLARRIHRDFTYDIEATDVATPVAAAFALRRGVCQDFAHVGVAALRALGLPAAYVSGFLRTEPPPGRPRLEGADATHAWLSIWCGSAVGWVGIDPTNGVLAGADHVAVAIGRDYADVAPVDGAIVASGGHSLHVTVDVRPLPLGQAP